MDNKLVSIIMASYNSADFIEDSIQSVLNQNYKNWELIISDDCSTDETKDIVAKYQKHDPRILFIEAKKNSGPAVTRNRAIKIANGRYIAFLDSDDLWTPDKLQKQVELMRNGKAVLSYGYYNIITEGGEVIKTIKKIPDSMSYDDLLKNQVIGCLTAVYDRKICGTQTMPIIRKRQDFGLWLRILEQGHTAICVNSVIGSYRLRKGSISSNKWIAIQYTWKIYRDIEKLSFIKSCYVFTHYIVRRLLRV